MLESSQEEDIRQCDHIGVVKFHACTAKSSSAEQKRADSLSMLLRHCLRLNRTSKYTCVRCTHMVYVSILLVT